MAIIFDGKNQCFFLNTETSSYVIELYHRKHLIHRYWGKTITMLPPVNEIFPYESNSFDTTDWPDYEVTTSSLATMEFATYGSGDIRTPSLHIQYEDGSTVSDFLYDCHKITKGKPGLQGLPATYGTEEETETLEITLKDQKTGGVVVLMYSVFEKQNAIARSMRIENTGQEEMYLSQVMSCTMDFLDNRYEFLHLHGAWGRERNVERRALLQGNVSIDSKKGASSHDHNPFFALVRPETTEIAGDAYGFSFVYSGNFLAGAEVDHFNRTRAYLGLNPFDFSWILEPGDTFQTPEAVLVHSAEGLGGMSRSFHQLYRKNLIRGKYRDEIRPVLVNNWEATYFNFDETKILAIAEKAKEIGIDMLVLDDGWFGKRDTDNCSLGDWVEDLNKLPNGLKGLGEKINQMGLRFGLWFEPEMVSPDSDLYRAHPDWCIHVEGRRRSQARRQLILDFSRQEVCDYIYESVSKVLRQAPIAYVKWDMNRNMSEIGSAGLSAERQRELPHRYILGLYGVLEKLVTEFPDVLFESCSGGGGRFDPGMLYYMPQTWTSDDSDAVERLFIQYGTSMVYPASAMGAHVSAVPNHQVSRMTTLEMRGAVAMLGQFGYELDISKWSEEEAEEAKRQVAFYKKYRTVIQNGQMYRLCSPFEGDRNRAAWQFISEDQKTVMVFSFYILGKPHPVSENLCLQGLDDKAVYVQTTDEMKYTGDYLMNAGLWERPKKDYQTKIYIFEKQ